MIVLLSPAKTLDFKTAAISSNFSEHIFEYENKQLVDVLSQLSELDLQELMKISPDLARLNFERYQSMKNFPSEVPGKQAISVFTGEAYRGLNALDFAEEDFEFAQKHLRILSGFYGVLRPLDLIRPHRLEMGTKIKVGKTENLYKFWGNKITETINQDLKGEKIIINLASDEYFKSINTKKLDAEIITPKFLDNKHDKYKMITVYAKNARGAMTRHIIKNKITKAFEIKNSRVNDYKFSKEKSGELNWVFLRG
jgi:uncharacterized protein